MHVDGRHKVATMRIGDLPKYCGRIGRFRHLLWRKCEEKVSRRDVTKWASYSCRRDNPEEYAEIIAREFRQGLPSVIRRSTEGLVPEIALQFLGASRGMGMPVGLFSIGKDEQDAI